MSYGRSAIATLLVLCVSAPGTLVGEPLSPSGTSPIPNGDFESGNSVWASASTHDLQLYPLMVQAFELPSGVTPQGGNWAVWLGGFLSDTSSIEQSVVVPAIAPKLTAWYWITSEESACGFDTLSVTVNSMVVDSPALCASTGTSGWVLRTVNLSAWAGQTATLRLQVTTDSTQNTNVFIDTLQFDVALDPVFDDGFES